MELKDTMGFLYKKESAQLKCTEVLPHTIRVNFNHAALHHRLGFWCCASAYAKSRQQQQ